MRKVSAGTAGNNHSRFYQLDLVLDAVQGNRIYLGTLFKEAMVMTNPMNPNFVPPGMIVEESQKIHLPSGNLRELKKLRITLQSPPGLFRISSTIEAVPPLDCSCAPVHMHDIAECCLCLSVVCVSRHSFTCVRCGRVFCTGCGKVFAVEGQALQICKPCHEELSTGKIIKTLKNIIWG